MSRKLADLLALNRAMVIVLLTVLLFGLGEQLWSQLMPAYLDAQAKKLAQQEATQGIVPERVLWIVGIYACLRNLFEGFCYVGGGQITARLGDRGSLILFALLSISGYTLFLLSDSPALAVAAALLIMGWEPLSVPVTFTTVGASVVSAKRGMAFAVQSIQKRLPKIVGPLIGGLVLGAAAQMTGDEVGGRVVGMRWLVWAALGLAIFTILMQIRFMPHHPLPARGPTGLEVLSFFPRELKRLLVVEIFTRWCDWMVRELVVLYVLVTRGVRIEELGMLIALQNVIALLTYLPIGRMTERYGLQPFVGMTFVFFALFPLVLSLVPTPWLWVAYVVYGLREIGEPARKALITTSLPAEIRARGVGWYWGLRSFAICTASLVGAWVWSAWGPEAMLAAAFLLGAIGAVGYYATVVIKPDTPAISG